jgi:hypothetical protein
MSHSGTLVDCRHVEVFKYSWLMKGNIRLILNAKTDEKINK